MKDNSKSFPRIKDIKPVNGIRFTKQNVNNLTEHINKCEAWIEGYEKELRELLRVRRIAVLLDRNEKLGLRPDDAIAWFIKKELLGGEV